MAPTRGNRGSRKQTDKTAQETPKSAKASTSSSAAKPQTNATTKNHKSATVTEIKEPDSSGKTQVRQKGNATTKDQETSRHSWGNASLDGGVPVTLENDSEARDNETPKKLDNFKKDTVYLEAPSTSKDAKVASTKSNRTGASAKDGSTSAAQGRNDATPNEKESAGSSSESTSGNSSSVSETDATSESTDNTAPRRTTRSLAPVPNLVFNKPRRTTRDTPLRRAQKTYKSLRTSNEKALEKLGKQLSAQLSQQRRAWTEAVDRVIEDRMATSHQKHLYAHLHLQGQATHHAQLTQALAAVQTLGQEVESMSAELKEVKSEMQVRKKRRADKSSDEMIVSKWSELRKKIEQLAAGLSGFALSLWPEHVLWRLRLLTSRIKVTRRDLRGNAPEPYLKAYLWHVVFTNVFHTTSSAWISEPRATLSELKTNIINATVLKTERMVDLQQWLREGADLLEQASNDPTSSRVLDQLVEAEAHGLFRYLLSEDIGADARESITAQVRKVFSTALELHQMMLFSKDFFHVSMSHDWKKYDPKRMDRIESSGGAAFTKEVKMVVSPLLMKETVSNDEPHSECSVLIKSQVICERLKNADDAMVFVKKVKKTAAQNTSTTAKSDGKTGGKAKESSAKTGEKGKTSEGE